MALSNDTKNRLSYALASATAAAELAAEIDTASPGQIALASGHMLVGSAGGVAADVAMSGDATIAATGVVTVASVNGKKFAQSAAPLSVTGTSNINTGLATLVSVTAALAEVANLSGNVVTCSALASAGWFQVQVWKPTTSSDNTPVAASAAKLINWIAVGT